MTGLEREVSRRYLALLDAAAQLAEFLGHEVIQEMIDMGWLYYQEGMFEITENGREQIGKNPFNLGGV
mgnify:CR=1 FL=1